MISSDDDESEVNLPLPTSQQNVVAKAATRIALYLTREDCDSGIEQQELQHAHDFFVVNSSKVNTLYFYFYYLLFYLYNLIWFALFNYFKKIVHKISTVSFFNIYFEKVFSIYTFHSPF